MENLDASQRAWVDDHLRTRDDYAGVKGWLEPLPGTTAYAFEDLHDAAHQLWVTLRRIVEDRIERVLDWLIRKP